MIAEIPLPDKLEFAQKLISSALAVAPNHPYFLDTQAWIYKAQGKWDEALSVESKALKDGSEDIVMLGHYAQLLWLDGKPSEAKMQCERILNLASNARGRTEKQYVAKAKT